jgi:hypothetical protein
MVGDDFRLGDPAALRICTSSADFPGDLAFDPLPVVVADLE